MSTAGGGDGQTLTSAQMAARVAAYQGDLEFKERCKRQDIDNLLQKDFRTVRYMVELAAAMGTTAEELRYGLERACEQTQDGGTSPVVVDINERRQEGLAQALRQVGMAFRDAKDPGRALARNILGTLLDHYDAGADDLVPTITKHLLGGSAGEAGEASGPLQKRK